MGLESRPHAIEQPIDIVVPTHNRLELTIRCIDSLYSHTANPFTLIVVDDSTDKITPLYFKELKKKNIKYIRSFTPYTEGNQYLNIAFSHATNPYIACVGNSICVEPDWDVGALNIFKARADVGLVGFKNLMGIGPSTGTIESAGIGMVNYLPVDIGKGSPGHRMTTLYEVPAVAWSFCMVRKEAVSNLPEGIYNGFRGWDDIDNCFVLRKAGWKIMYNGYGAGYHSPRATRGSNTEETHERNRENARRFYKRWGYWDAFTKEYGSDWPESPDGAVQMP